MQSTKLPRAICDEVEKKSYAFLWGSRPSHHKTLLVKWEDMCLPMGIGGWGLHNIRNANDVFLMKIGWLIITRPRGGSRKF